MTARSGHRWRLTALALAAVGGGSIAAYSVATRVQTSDDWRSHPCGSPQSPLKRELAAYLLGLDASRANAKPVLLTQMNAHFAGVSTLGEARARAIAAGATCPAVGTQSLDGRPFDCSVEVVCRYRTAYSYKVHERMVRASFDLDRKGAVSVLALSKGASGEYSQYAAEKVREGKWAK